MKEIILIIFQQWKNKIKKLLLIMLEFKIEYENKITKEKGSLIKNKFKLKKIILHNK